MRVSLERFVLRKRFALTISRGTSSQSTNVWVRLEDDGVQGWGESAPMRLGDVVQDAALVEQHLQRLVPLLEPCHPLERTRIARILREEDVPSSARAALDMALLDWMGKKVGLPLWQVWGLERAQIPLTSVTVGIDKPEAIKERVRDWSARAPGCALKIKLGSPEGIEADQAIIRAVREVAPDGVPLRVDANEGWDFDDAMTMAVWLDQEGVECIEQPLPRGQHGQMLSLRKVSRLPIFADESCMGLADIPRLAPLVDGVNIKLMKCGGPSEALRMIHAARACGLQVMLGCFSESALAIAAAVQLSPLVDVLDLDSHLNMRNAPFVAAPLEDGRIVPTLAPGLGVERGEGDV